MCQALARENEQGHEPFPADQAGGVLTATLPKSVATRLMNSLRHRIIDIRGQSIWANKSALERSETASLEIEAFPPPGFLPTFTAHMRKDLYGRKNSPNTENREPEEVKQAPRYTLPKALVHTKGEQPWYPNNSRPLILAQSRHASKQSGPLATTRSLAQRSSASVSNCPRPLICMQERACWTWRLAVGSRPLPPHAVFVR